MKYKLRIDYDEERNSQVWRMHVSNPDMTLEEIGRRFGLTRQRIHAIIKRYEEVKDGDRNIHTSTNC